MVEGLYRYVRNPMYAAVVTIVLGQALWHASWWVLAYGFLVWAVTAAFARFHEEPVLRNRFGSEYESYRRGVQRGSRGPGRGRHPRTLAGPPRSSKQSCSDITTKAPPAGFEPAAIRLEVCRSIQLSYGGGG